MKKKKGISDLYLIAECVGCGAKFRLSSESQVACNVVHKREFKSKGQQIFLTYYDCNSCGYRHFVQIDNKETLEMLKSNKRLFTRLAAKRVNDKPVPKKQIDKYKKQNDELYFVRNALMKEHTGSMLYDDETGNGFELRFSV